MYTIEIKGLERLQNAVEKSPRETFQMLNKSIRTSLNIIRPIMVQEAPRGKTGNLRKNIYVKVQGLEGEVGPNVNITPYARYVHDGTKPYEIRPLNKKALWWPGALHPVKLVKHPGIKANPFVERTYRQIKRPVEQIFEKNISDFIRNFNR